MSVTIDGKEKFDSSRATFSKIIRQAAILTAAKTVLESSLKDMQGILQAELHDNELSKAMDLYESDYLRLAGVIAGVVLEGHLSSVCLNNAITIVKSNPTLADYNELLKNYNVIDVPNWRWILRLGDIRNLCDHKKDREPTEDEVLELINGVDKTIKTIF